MMKERELREYLTETGDNPFREWLHALRDLQARARIRVRLNRVRLGNLGDCRPVGEGVMELRGWISVRGTGSISARQGTSWSSCSVVETDERKRGTS
jgi:hypothetical protein